MDWGPGWYPDFMPNLLPDWKPDLLIGYETLHQRVAAIKLSLVSITSSPCVETLCSKPQNRKKIKENLGVMLDLGGWGGIME